MPSSLASDVQPPATLSPPWPGWAGHDDHDDDDYDYYDYHDHDHDDFFSSCMADLTSTCPELEGTLLKKTKKFLVRFLLMVMVMMKMVMMVAMVIVMMTTLLKKIKKLFVRFNILSDHDYEASMPLKESLSQ